MLPPKVLIVDDSPMMLRFVSGVLTSRITPPPEVITARRAGEGLMRVAEAKPDVVLIDYGLPDLDGDVFCERVEASTISSRTWMPAIIAMCSQGAGPRALQTIVPVCAHATILKPFTPELLVATLLPLLTKEALRNRRATVFAAPAPPAPVAPPAPPTQHTPPATRPVRLQARLSVPSTIPTVVSSPSGAADPERPKAARRRLWISRPPLPGSTTEKATATAKPGRIVFRGNTPKFSLRSAFRMAADEKLTGVLRILPVGRAAPLPTEVFIRRGAIALVTTRDSSLYAEGGALPDQLDAGVVNAAVRGQADSGCPFPLLLQLRRLLADNEARDLTRELGQSFFARLWSTARVALEFEALEKLPEYVPHVSETSTFSVVEADDWLLGTLRRVRLEDLPGLEDERFDGAPAFTREGYETVPRLRLTEAETDFASRVDGRNGLGAIAAGLGLAPASAFLLLFCFRAIEAMDYWPASLLSRPTTALGADVPAEQKAAIQTRKVATTSSTSDPALGGEGLPASRPPAAEDSPPRLSGPWSKEPADRE